MSSLENWLCISRCVNLPFDWDFIWPVSLSCGHIQKGQKSNQGNARPNLLCFYFYETNYRLKYYINICHSKFCDFNFYTIYPIISILHLFDNKHSVLKKHSPIISCFGQKTFNLPHSHPHLDHEDSLFVSETPFLARDVWRVFPTVFAFALPKFHTVDHSFSVIYLFSNTYVTITSLFVCKSSLTVKSGKLV